MINRYLFTFKMPNNKVFARTFSTKEELNDYVEVRNLQDNPNTSTYDLLLKQGGL